MKNPRHALAPDAPGPVEEAGKAPPLPSPETPASPSRTTLLFRPEVLAERQTQWLGTVLLEPRRSHQLFSLFAALAVAAILGLFFFRDVTRTTRVAGWLVPDAGLVRVFPPQAGVVAAIHVREGSKVKKGERLLTLSGEVKSSALGATQAEVARLLQARRRTLEDQKDQIRRLLTQQQRGLETRLAALAAEEGPMDQEISLQKSRLQLARKSEARLRDLQRQGYISRQQLQQSEEDRLAQAGRLATLERERLAAARERLALENDLKDLPLKAQGDLAAMDREIAAIDQQLAEAEARREMVVAAPQDGRVTAILSAPGGHAETGTPLLTIVPADSRLEAHLYGPSRAVGFVRPGQAVFLRYQAYPYEKFGHYAGTVTAVSASPIKPGELPFAPAADGSLAAAAGEALYRITVRLERQTVAAYGEALPLQPGMQLEADLALDRRRLYEWVLDPLYALTGRASL